jgi:hypothetical protein
MKLITYLHLLQRFTAHGVIPPSLLSSGVVFGYAHRRHLSIIIGPPINLHFSVITQCFLTVK